MKLTKLECAHRRIFMKGFVGGITVMFGSFLFKDHSIVPSVEGEFVLVDGWVMLKNDFL